MDTTTNPTRETETETHVRNHTKGMLKKETFVTVITDTKGVTESHTNNHLRHHFNKTLPL